MTAPREEGPDEAELAFEAYLKEEFPEEDADGEAFHDTPAVDHFISGYEAGKKALAPLAAKAKAMENMAEALLWAEDFFRSRDHMNTLVHCAPIRLSPITDRVIMARAAWGAASRK